VDGLSVDDLASSFLRWRRHERLGPAWPVLWWGSVSGCGARRPPCRPRCWNWLTVQVATRPRRRALRRRWAGSQRVTAAPAPVPHPELPFDVRVKVEQSAIRWTCCLVRRPGSRRSRGTSTCPTDARHMPAYDPGFLSLPSEIAVRVLSHNRGQDGPRGFLSRLRAG